MAGDKTDKTPAATLATTATQKRANKKRANKKPPDMPPDMETIRDLNEALSADPLAKFVFTLHWRASTLLDNNNLSKAAITLEMMQSAFSAFENDLKHKDIAAGYPVTAWREDTVEIPRAWLRAMVEGWEKYKSGYTGSDFGGAFGIEGGGKSKGKTRQKLSQINKDIRRSNKVLIEFHAMQLEDGPAASLSKAYGVVANSEGVDEKTLMRACERHLNATRNREVLLSLLSK